MEHFSVLERAVAVWMINGSGNALWLLGSGHKSSLIHFEHWLEHIFTTVVHDVFESIVARIVEETHVVEMALINFDWTSIVAHHKLLERQMANVPTITFPIRDELRESLWLLHFWSSLELPNTTWNL